MLKIIKEEELKPKKKEYLKSKKLNEADAVERMPVEIIPALRFYQIAGRLNTVLMAYEETDLNYSKTNELKSNLEQLENLLCNIESILECEIVNNSIYKE